MTSAYRDAYEHIVGEKLAEATEIRAQVVPHLPAVRKIFWVRLTRITGGLVGIAASALMCWFAATTKNEEASLALLGGIFAMLVSWLVSRVVVEGGLKAFRYRGAEEPKLVGEATQDLALIDASDARKALHRLERRANRLEIASLALPMIGLAFLFPLFSHWLFLEIFSNHETLSELSEWIRISLVVVGHAHIALAVCAYLFAKKLKALPTDHLFGVKIHREWLKAWLVTVGVSCLPGIILILVPPLLVAATGIAFIPFMFMGLFRSLQMERATMERAALATKRPEERIRLAEEEKRADRREDENGGGDAHYYPEGEPALLGGDVRNGG